MLLLETPGFTNYIPTTVLGLLGLLFAYLYSLYRNRDKTKLANLKAIPSAQRSKVVEMMLNDLGVQLDLATLNGKQKFDLVTRLIRAKTRKYLIIALTSIVLSLVVAFIIWSNYRITNQSAVQKDSDKTSVPLDTQRISHVHDTVVKTVFQTVAAPVVEDHKEDNKKVVQKVDQKPQQNRPAQPQTYSVTLVSVKIALGTLVMDGNSIGEFNLDKGINTFHNITPGYHEFEVQSFRWYGEDPAQDPLIMSAVRKIYVDNDLTIQVTMTLRDDPTSTTSRQIPGSNLEVVRH